MDSVLNTPPFDMPLKDMAFDDIAIGTKVVRIAWNGEISHGNIILKKGYDSLNYFNRQPIYREDFVIEFNDWRGLELHPHSSMHNLFLDKGADAEYHIDNQSYQMLVGMLSNKYAGQK